MNAEEFSNEFDILYNNITSNQAPGLDEYEKSVFLTKAQDEILKAYFNPKLNKTQEGFDDTTKRQADFYKLIKSTTFASASLIVDADLQITNTPDWLFILNESVLVTFKDNTTATLTVVPINHTTYSRLLNKPFKRSLKNQAWKLVVNNEPLTLRFITPMPYKNLKYSVRYIKKPYPIILLDNLDGYPSIGGKTEMYDVGNSEVCELDSSIHPEILQRAVELAKSAYMGDLTSQLTLGQASGTNMGIVSSQ